MYINYNSTVLGILSRYDTVYIMHGNINSSE